MGIEGAVDCTGGNVRHFAGLEQAVFLADPLFGHALHHVDEFFPMRVQVEGVAEAGAHVGADEEEALGGDKVGAAEPVVFGPGVNFARGQGGGDEGGEHAATVWAV